VEQEKGGMEQHTARNSGGEGTEKGKGGDGTGEEGVLEGKIEKESAVEQNKKGAEHCSGGGGVH
jgi:hypothetical protein